MAVNKMNDTNTNGAETSEFQLLNESSMSSEDRQEILSHIDKVVEDNKIPVTRDTFSYKTKKRGILLPILINLIAALAIGAAFFVSARFFEQRKETLSIETQTYLSAEGRLIEELKKESETKLRQKDDQISAIQLDLNRIDQERQELQQTMESRIQEREDELKQALEQQLALERARLRALGTSDEDIDTRLSEFAEKIESDHAAEIETFKAQAEEAILAKEEELRQTRDLTNQVLAEAKAERQQLEEKSQLREEELVSQYEEEKLALAEKTSETEQQLENLTVARQQEQMISDQISGTYSLIKQKLADNQFDEAKQHLSRLELLLYDPAIESLPTIARRRQADLFIIESLDTLIETRIAGEKEDANSSLIETANLIATAQGIIARADTMYANGDFQSAAEAYEDALSLVPVFSRAYTAKEEIELEEQKTLIIRSLAEGTAVLNQGDISAAIGRYRESVVAGAAGNVSYLEQALNGIEDALKMEANTVIAAKDAEIDGLETKLSGASSTASTLQRDLTSAKKSVDTLTGQLSEQKAEVARQVSQINSLKTDIDDLNSQIREKTQDAADFEALAAEKSVDNSTLEAKVSLLETELAQLENSLEQALSNVSALERSLSEKEADLDSALQSTAQKEAELESVRSELESKAGELEKLQAETAEANTAAIAEIESVQTQIAEKDARIELLQEDLSAKTEELLSAQTEIDTLKQKADAAEDLTAETAGREADLKIELESIRSRLVAAQNTIAQLSESLAESETTIEELTAQANFKSAATASVEELKLAKLRNDYQPYKEKITLLLDDGSDEKYYEARTVLFDFSRRVSEVAFPGISNLWNVTEEAVMEIERKSSQTSGTAMALENVLLFLQFVQGESDTAMGSRIQFDALIEKDAGYRQVFFEIDELAEKSGLGASGLYSLEVTAIGEVADFAEGKATVTLFERVVVEKDARVLFRRRDAEGESAVAQGIVRGIENGRAEIDIEHLFDSQTPVEGDPVYLEEER